MSGHKWIDEKCSLCGDKDWFADKFCGKNPDYKREYEEWLKSLKQESLQAQGETIREGVNV